jgi:hypothetical protein
MTDKIERKYVGNTRGKPFQHGNPGKPRGARHRTTLAVERLLDGEAEGLTRKAIEKASEGDMVALRLCLDRILPVRRDRHIAFRLPTMESAADAKSAVAAIIEAVAKGILTPSEAGELGKLVDSFTKAAEALEIVERITRLEEAVNARRR